MGKTIRNLAVAAAALAIFTGSAGAQGRGHGKGNKGASAEKGDKSRSTVISGGDVVVVHHDRRVPPGLAKKPGQMPPGQYKKMYTVNEGTNVLRDVFGRHGYTVTRVVPSGTSRYVYYRRPDGQVVRAVVSPGTDRLGFVNVPSLILNELLTRLY